MNQMSKFALVCDIETLSTRSNAVVSEAAFTLINTQDGNVEGQYHAYFNQEQQKGHICDETMQWLKENVPERVLSARNANCDAIPNNKIEMIRLIDEINQNVISIAGSFEDVAIYGYGSNFDQPVFTTFAQGLLGKNNPFPWSFRREFCLRTLESYFFTKTESKELKKNIKQSLENYYGRELILHTAIDDSLIEAKLLHEVHKKFKMLML